MFCGLVTVGSLIWKKGYEPLLQSLRSLVDRGVQARLRIVGDGAERQRVLYTIRDLGLQSEVDLVGRLEDGRVREELQQADVFVLSSLSEGISNAALEAMACGLPVVSTQVGGMAEAIEDGVEGFLVPPWDPDALTKAMSRLDEEYELRGRMGTAARNRVLAQFSIHQQIESWRDLLSSVVDRPTAANRL